MTQVLPHHQRSLDGPLIPTQTRGILAHLGELYRYRELLYNLTLRDLKARYKGSVLGFLWSLMNPLLLMVVLTVVFAVLMRGSTIPRFPLFVLTGILAWNLHLTAVNGGIYSLVNNANLINKVYFPREFLPLSSVLANTVNFLLSLVALFVLMALLQVSPSLAVVVFPVVLLTQVLFDVGLAFVLSTFHVFYRDTGLIMETLMLAWFFLTPIFYRMEDLFPEYARLVYILNPMASIVSSYQIIFYYGVWPDPFFLLRTLATALLVCLAGYAVFLYFAPRFAEEL